MIKGATISIENDGSFADEIGAQRLEYEPEIYENYNPRFSSPEAPVADNAITPLEALVDRLITGRKDTGFDINPTGPRERPNIVEAPALAAGAIAMAATDRQVASINPGQKYNVSEKPKSTQFFQGQNVAEQKNDTKLEQTGIATDILASARDKLVGAQQAHRANPYNSAVNGAQAQAGMNARDPINQPASGGLVKSMVLGSAAASVASFLAPGAVPVVKALATASTVSAATNSASMSFTNASTSYDRPRTKAEAREMRDPASASSMSATSNHFDQMTSGAIIEPPSKFNRDFGSAIANTSRAPSDELDPFIAQDRELTASLGITQRNLDLQENQERDAKFAQEAHERWRNDGTSRYGLNDIADAARSGAFKGSDKYLAGLRHIEDLTQISIMQERNLIPTPPDNFDFAPPSGMKMGA